MGQAEPIDPKDDSAPHADWLVGPEEGLAAEMDRGRESVRFAPKLVRPGETGDGSALPAPELRLSDGGPGDEGTVVKRPPPTLSRPAPPPGVQTDVFEALEAERAARGENASPANPASASWIRPEGLKGHASAAPTPTPGAMGWEPGANSVPSLRQPEPRANAPTPVPERDFPMDDAEERTNVAGRSAAEQAPAEPVAVRQHQVVTADEFEMAAPPMPWWMQAAHHVRDNRRVQIILGIVVLAFVVVAAWPSGERTVSLAHLRQGAAQFDGQVVRVSGKVGEVFQVGGGYAFYLHQGRDTLVVFTRGSEPSPRKHVVLSGTISTGYLDGRPHLALFQSAAPTK